MIVGGKDEIRSDKKCVLQTVNYFFNTPYATSFFYDG